MVDLGAGIQWVFPGDGGGFLTLESLNHQSHCRQVKFRIPLFTIQGFSERGAGKEGGRDGQRVVARNRWDSLRRASLEKIPSSA